MRGPGLSAVYCGAKNPPLAPVLHTYAQKGFGEEEKLRVLGCCGEKAPQRLLHL